jgi:pilus assembly protein Flp/PilA
MRLALVRAALRATRQDDSCIGLCAVQGCARFSGGLPTMTYPISVLSSILTRRQEGQGLAEYALILALIAIVAILALTFLGTQISTILSYVGSAI